MFLKRENISKGTFSPNTAFYFSCVYGYDFPLRIYQNVVIISCQRRVTNIAIQSDFRLFVGVSQEVPDIPFSVFFFVADLISVVFHFQPLCRSDKSAELRFETNAAEFRTHIVGKVFDVSAGVTFFQVGSVIFPFFVIVRNVEESK